MPSALGNLLLSEPVSWNANGTDGHGLTLLLSLWYLVVLAAQDVFNANDDRWDLNLFCISLLTAQRVSRGIMECNHFVDLAYRRAPHDRVRRHGATRDVFFCSWEIISLQKVLR